MTYKQMQTAKKAKIYGVPIEEEPVTTVPDGWEE
jgi:hypothetical protein